MAPGVNPTSIRSVKIGMTERQVTAILGQPLRMRDWGDRGVLHDYAIPGEAFSSPGLWIYFDKGAVQNVQGERHHLIREDQTVYEARPDMLTFESVDFEQTFNTVR
jgi:hypothetical protein